MSESNAVGNQRSNPLPRLAAARSGKPAGGTQTLLGRGVLVDAFAEVFASMAVAESPQRRELSRLAGEPVDREPASADSGPAAQRPPERTDSPQQASDRSASHCAVTFEPAAQEVDEPDAQPTVAPDAARAAGNDQGSPPDAEPASGFSAAAEINPKHASESHTAGTFSAPASGAKKPTSEKTVRPNRGDGESGRENAPLDAARPSPRGHGAAADAAKPQSAAANPDAPARPAEPVETASGASNGESFEQRDQQSQGRSAVDREAAGGESEQSDPRQREKGTRRAGEEKGADRHRSQKSPDAVMPGSQDSPTSASRQPHPPSPGAAASAAHSAAHARSASPTTTSASTTTAGRTASGVSPLRSVSNTGGAPASASGTESAAPADKSSQAKPAQAGDRAGKSNRSSAADAVSRAKLIQRVSKAFQHLGPGGGSVRLRLAPAELGTVRVEMRIQNKQVHARVTAETDAASGVLREHLPDLRARLEAQGMQLERIEIETEESDRRSSGGFGDASDSRGGEQRSGTGQQRFRQPTSLRPQQTPAPAGHEASAQLVSANVASPSSGVDIRF